MSDRFSGHRPQDGADTAGTPWAGRTLTGTGFDNDTGEADGRLARLLDGDDPAPGEVVAALAEARLIVPVVAVPGEVDTSSGIPADASSDMAAVTLVASDGQRALPAFTSTTALTAWDPQARPVPVTAQRAALAAVQEGCTVIPLDLPPAPGAAAYTLSGSMVWALAMAREWVPAHRLSGTAGELVVELGLRPGLTGPQVQALVTRVGEGLAVDAETRARIDAVTFRLLTA